MLSDIRVIVHRVYPDSLSNGASMVYTTISMLTYAQAILLGLLQGVAELFPISSLGHTVLIPSLLRWNIDQSGADFVAFVVLTHLATALVLLAFFWSDWVKIISGILRSLKRRVISESDTYAKLGWLIVVSTVPVGILGLLFEEKIAKLFAEPRLVAGALVLNGIVLFVAEQLRTHASSERGDAQIAHLSWGQAVVVGCAQCFALIPGFSRTGLTMTGGLLTHLSRENAARYAFLLATPIIFAAAVLKVPDLVLTGGTALYTSLVGAACAAIAAYCSVTFLTAHFKTKTLTPFAVYCMLAGGISLLLLL